MGERLTVQFAKGGRNRENDPRFERPTPRPRRTPFKMSISNLPLETSWQVRFLPFSSSFHLDSGLIFGFYCLAGKALDLPWI
jgi:hypothetical protein